jgi:hypothetical protein
MDRDMVILETATFFTDEQSQWGHAAFNDQVDPEEDIVTGSEDII